MCRPEYLDCSSINLTGYRNWAATTDVFKQCTADDDNFKYGIFQNAVQKNVISSDFFHKYFYCLWWGLQQLRYAFLPSLSAYIFWVGTRGCC